MHHSCDCRQPCPGGRQLLTGGTQAAGLSLEVPGIEGLKNQDTGTRSSKPEFRPAHSDSGAPDLHLPCLVWRLALERTSQVT